MLQYLVFAEHVLQFTCKMSYSASQGKNQAVVGNNKEMWCSEFATYFLCFFLQCDRHVQAKVLEGVLCDTVS